MRLKDGGRGYARRETQNVVLVGPRRQKNTKCRKLEKFKMGDWAYELGSVGAEILCPGRGEEDGVHSASGWQKYGQRTRDLVFSPVGRCNQRRRADGSEMMRLRRLTMTWPKMGRASALRARPKSIIEEPGGHGGRDGRAEL